MRDGRASSIKEEEKIPEGDKICRVCDKIIPEGEAAILISGRLLYVGRRLNSWVVTGWRHTKCCIPPSAQRREPQLGEGWWVKKNPAQGGGRKGEK